MRALILAGGLGTRLRPITDTMPKCLVPIHGRPLLSYWFDRLLGQGIERVLVNTAYLAEAVRAFVAASPWRDRIDLIHEETLLGTGGTVLANRNWFGPGPFLVAHGDNLSLFDVGDFAAAHRRRPADCVATMMTFETDDPSSCGIVTLDNRGVAVQFHEKTRHPPGNLANGAVYIFEPEIVDFLKSLNKSTIDISTEVIPIFTGRIMTFHNARYHRDIGTIERLALAHAETEEAQFR